MSKQDALRPIPGPWLMAISGTAASWGEFCTIPFDTAKVRLQLQDGNHPQYSGLVDCLRKMLRDEGVRAPWKGVMAGVQRQLAFVCDCDTLTFDHDSESVRSD